MHTQHDISTVEIRGAELWRCEAKNYRDYANRNDVGEKNNLYSK